MALNKKGKFASDQNRIASYARAIAHPARVAILETLAERTACICGEIVEVMPLAQSTVSQHLKELKDAGLIKGEIEGPRSCYCLDLDRLREAAQLLNGFFNDITASSPATVCRD
jgi:ArsR family transcriptional regulator